MNKKKLYAPSDFNIVSLNESHKDNILEFKSYETELVDFLRDDALNNQKSGVSHTYLFFLKNNKKLVGYVSVLNDSIRLSSDMKDKYMHGEGIPYKALPALKIGRLCVSDSFLRKGLGTIMIKFVFRIALEVNTFAGCRFITLDAKRNNDCKKDALHFYKKLDFQVLKDRNKGTVPMYYDLINLIKAKNNFEKNRN